MIKHAFCLVTAFLVLAQAGQLWGWADGGHKVVALIAYERLSPQERASVIALLRNHPQWEEMFAKPMAADLPHGSPQDQERWLFARAAVWPDLVRAPAGVSADQNPNRAYHHGTWHYTDLPVFASEEARKELPKHDKDPFMQWHPGWHESVRGWNSVQVLKMVLYDLPRPDLAAPDRAVELCWLFHLLGDMHQPCHCVSLFASGFLKGGDRGANSLTFAGSNGLPLHAFWDNQLNEGAHEVAFAKAETLAQALLAQKDLVQAAERVQDVTDPEAWLQEGRKIAIAHVYTPALLAAVKSAHAVSYSHDGKDYNMLELKLADADLNAYKHQAKELADQQVVIAGLRLAKALRQ